MIVKRVACTLGLAALLMLGSRSLLFGSAAPGVEVKIDNFSFAPKALTVPVGTTVTWVNHDDIPHTVVSTDQVFKSKTLDTDDKFSYAFTKAGRYPYFCSIHPKMTGEVVVQ
ncbi:MAG: cupredoxin family copper-binding protein [Acidobacteria bacterium]|nr:cupredoxin family copper-binding protein [Acidobacteriota bacterium]